MKNFFLLYLLLIPAIYLPAQQKEFIFKNFTQEEGLPSNESYFVFEDSKHYIWIATDLGVVRYYGNKFEQFNLPDNVVFKIKEDSKGRIWFFSHKAELAYFENEKMHIFKYNAGILKRIDKIHIMDCCVDEKDNILLNSHLDSNFIISPAGGITASNHAFQYGQPNIFTINYLKPDNCFTTLNQLGGTGTEDSFYINVNRKNSNTKYAIKIVHSSFAHYGSTSADGKNIYFFAGYTLFKLSEDGSFSTRQMPSRILSTRVFKDNLLVGMYKKGGVLVSTDLLSQQADTILPNRSITSIATDYEGGLWLSTQENGVYYAKNTFITHLADKDLANAYVTRVLNLNDSALIYSKATGLYDLSDPGTPFFKYNNLVTVDMFAGKNKSLYLFGSATSQFEVKKIKSTHFNSIHLFDTPSEHIQLGEGTLVICSPASVILMKDLNLSLLPNNTVRNFKQLLSKQSKLFLDARKNIWAGANDGLYRSNKMYDTLLKFNPGATLLNQGISCLNQMKNGLITAGIRFSGIVLINDTGIIAGITENDGLSSNKVRFLLPIDDELWAATAKGISVIKFSSFYPARYTITNIGKNDGFYNVTIQQLIRYKKSIVAATSNGLYFIEEPKEFLNRQLPEIPFYINAVSSYKGDTSDIADISLPYSKSKVTIKYSAVSFNSYESISYLYRLADGDTIWHSTTNTEYLLENLEPGTYHLQVKAAIASQQRSSRVNTLSITIEKPWWQNNWFRLFCLLLVAWAVYLLVKRRIKKIKEEEKRKTDLNAKLTELEQTALRSQMNPHFIFNCLTSIQQLIISGNKTDANEYLVKFSRLIRKTLEMSARPFISIREEKEYLEEYLFLEQLRLSDRFTYQVVAHSSINSDNTFIPNMMIQPVVENSVRHGIKSLGNRQGLIKVSFEPGENSVTCTITDNGVGRNNTSSFSEKAFTKHKSYGMDILRRRLETFSEFNVGKSDIEINDLYDADGAAAGTEVILHLPLKKQV